MSYSIYKHFSYFLKLTRIVQRQTHGQHLLWYQMDEMHLKKNNSLESFTVRKMNASIK